MNRSSRAAVPLLALVLIVSAGVGACTSPAAADRITVLGPWTGVQEQQFEVVLAEFEERTGVEVDYTGTSAVDQVLQSDVQQGNPPDIAIVDSPGDFVRYRAQLQPLDDIVASYWSDYSPQWQQLVRLGGEVLYAVPVRADLKGMVWFRPGHLPRVPQTFEELVTLGASLAANGRIPWCVGVAAPSTSGWPGTDWIEDILLRQSGMEAYRQWVSGTLPWTSVQVRLAWTTWGDLVTGDGQVPGGPTGALLTGFRDASAPIHDDQPGCLMEHQASFIYGLDADESGSPRRATGFDFFLFPPFDGTDARNPRVVSANLAALFNDTQPARNLIRFLVSPDGQRTWPSGNYFSASTQVPIAAYHTRVAARIAAELTGTDPLCFDASDLMPGTMRDAFNRAVLEYLSDPARLDSLLERLDRIRTEPGEQWLTVACGL